MSCFRRSAKGVERPANCLGTDQRRTSVSQAKPEQFGHHGRLPRVPRYQRDMVRELARREGTSVDAVLARELEDVVSAHAEEMAGAMPELAGVLAWPETDLGADLRVAPRAQASRE